MSISLGLDLSLAGTGIVALGTVEGQEIMHESRIESAKHGVQRVLEIESEVTAVITKYKPSLVCLEGYAFARANQAHQIGELGGVIRRMLTIIMGEELWIEVSPGQVKKFATGSGNAKKDQVMLGAYKRWGYEADNSDLADAFVLAKIGQILLQGGLECEQLQNNEQRAVIKELEKKFKVSAE